MWDFLQFILLISALSGKHLTVPTGLGVLVLSPWLITLTSTPGPHSSFVHLGAAWIPSPHSPTFSEFSLEGFGDGFLPYSFHYPLAGCLPDFSFYLKFLTVWWHVLVFPWVYRFLSWVLRVTQIWVLILSLSHEFPPRELPFSSSSSF